MLKNCHIQIGRSFLWARSRLYGWSKQSTCPNADWSQRGSCTVERRRVTGFGAICELSNKSYIYGPQLYVHL